MKRIIASAGLVALGTAGVQAAYAPGLGPMETSKPWSISASLRGFYDDNYLTAPKSIERDSFGIEFSPGFSLNFPFERSYIGFSYLYSLRYYEDRTDEPVDHTHEFVVKGEHRFSERYKVSLNNSFVIAQEPEVVFALGTVEVPLRGEGDVIRNRADLAFHAQLTELVSGVFSYNNIYYDYEQEGIGSRSALLDRIEHYLDANARWNLRPNLVALGGYRFGFADYTSDELLAPGGLPGDVRDNVSHSFYVGADYAFTSQFSASGRVGVRYTTWDSPIDQDDLSPYVDVNGTYTYLPGSYVQLGLRHDRNATDVAGSGTAGDLTLDQQTTTLYASVNHRITPRVTGTLLGQAQHGIFEGGALDGETDNFFLLGAEVEYRITPNWAATAGYNFDRLDSDAGFRSFTRNRFTLGVRANY